MAVPVTGGNVTLAETDRRFIHECFNKDTLRRNRERVTETGVEAGSEEPFRVAFPSLESTA